MSIPYAQGRDMLLQAVRPLDTETVPLAQSLGRVLARDLTAPENVPAFDRSPYDGFAFRAQDSLAAPVTLRILEEIPAGSVGRFPVTEGTAVKILTGAPIPQGADAVVMFEKTRFTDTTVTILKPARPGENIVQAGEDVRAGALLAAAGSRIDPGLMGTLAAQGIAQPEVYRVPRVGVLSTGSELLALGQEPQPGKIFNSNSYTLMGTLEKLGCRPVLYGIARDTVEDIAQLLEQALTQCDAVVLTGGVSVGDYDLTPAAMEACGVSLLFRGTGMKPGMACAYGIRQGKPVSALSGNPASALTNFHLIAAPALRKLMGEADPLARTIRVRLEASFSKGSPVDRVLRGQLDLSDGTARMRLSGGQGNGVLSSAIGCDVLAVIPGGSGPVEPGTELEGILL